MLNSPDWFVMYHIAINTRMNVFKIIHTVLSYNISKLDFIKTLIWEKLEPYQSKMNCHFFWLLMMSDGCWYLLSWQARCVLFKRPVSKAVQKAWCKWSGWFRVKSCHVICWRVHVIVWRAVSRLSVPCHNVSWLIRVKIDPCRAVSMLDVNVEVQCWMSMLNVKCQHA